jgi:hypothetical protein
MKAATSLAELISDQACRKWRHPPQRGALRENVPCACGCGETFTTTDRRKKFFDFMCSQREGARRAHRKQKSS